MSHDIDAYFQALGGAANICDAEAYISRVRVGIADLSLIDNVAIRNLGAYAIVCQRDAIQLIVGDDAEALAYALKDKAGISHRCC